MMGMAVPAPGTGGKGNQWRLPVAKPSPDLSFLRCWALQGVGLGFAFPGSHVWSGQWRPAGLAGVLPSPPPPVQLSFACAPESSAVGHSTCASHVSAGIPFRAYIGCDATTKHQDDGDTGPVSA